MKLWLDGVPPAILAEAARTGLLVGRLGLTDPKGNPTCSACRPPAIEWSAGTAWPGTTGLMRRAATCRGVTSVLISPGGAYEADLTA